MIDHTYNSITSVKNLCEAWSEFVHGKKKKKDVAKFSLNLPHNIFELHEDLRTKVYRHGEYEAFLIHDPKPRSIHKATVRDRLLHRALYRVLCSYFDRKFIHDAYSCRHFKGTHKAVKRFNQFVRKVSKNNSRACWVLKCDVRKFFASIDHAILIEIVKTHISDPDIVWLIERIVESFTSTGHGKGLPLGNVTSQLLVNVYMNEFDQFIKHGLKQKQYIRYADDFVIMHHDKNILMEVLSKVCDFLSERLKLLVHPDKTFFQTATSGVDFLGWVSFPNHRILRTTTKKRMFKNIKTKGTKTEMVKSYLELLCHGNTYKLQKKVEEQLRDGRIGGTVPAMST